MTPAKMCWSPSGTLLVADMENHRVQELTADGVFIREFVLSGVSAHVLSVACCGTTLAVGVRHAVPIVLFDLDSGEQQTGGVQYHRHFSGVNRACSGVECLSDDRFLCVDSVSLAGSGILLHRDTRNRGTLRYDDDFDPDLACPVDIKVLSNGNILDLDDSMGLMLLSSESGAVLQRGGKRGNGPGAFKSPEAMAVWRQFVFTADKHSTHINIFL